jgi:hypothetical protein
MNAPPPGPSRRAVLQPWLHNGGLLGALLLAGASLGELLFSLWCERLAYAAWLRAAIARAGVGAHPLPVSSRDGRPRSRRLDRLAGELLAVSAGLGLLLVVVLVGARLGPELPLWTWTGHGLLLAAALGLAAALADLLASPRADPATRLPQAYHEASRRLGIDIVLLLLVPWSSLLLGDSLVLVLLFVLRAAIEARSRQTA